MNLDIDRDWAGLRSQAKADSRDELSKSSDDLSEIFRTLEWDMSFKNIETWTSKLNLVSETHEQRIRDLEKSTRDLEHRTRNLEEGTRNLKESIQNLEECNQDLEECTQNLEECTQNLEERTRDLEERTRDLEERIRGLKEWGLRRIREVFGTDTEGYGNI
jgi:vacuolar-type H+-ATPase subunit I/STV1